MALVNQQSVIQLVVDNNDFDTLGVILDHLKDSQKEVLDQLAEHAFQTNNSNLRKQLSQLMGNRKVPFLEKEFERNQRIQKVSQRLSLKMGSPKEASVHCACSSKAEPAVDTQTLRKNLSELEEVN